MRRGEYDVAVVEAQFPKRQTLAEETTLRLDVRNDDDKRAVPNVAATVRTRPANSGDASIGFGQTVDEPGLADAARPVWILDDGPGGGTTGYVDTWALGRLEPGQTRTFTWVLTAARPGTFQLDYAVAPGLTGVARSSAQDASGTLRVTIDGGTVGSVVVDGNKVVRLEPPR